MASEDFSQNFSRSDRELVCRRIVLGYRFWQRPAHLATAPVSLRCRTAITDLNSVSLAAATIRTLSRRPLSPSRGLAANGAVNLTPLAIPRRLVPVSTKREKSSRDGGRLRMPRGPTLLVFWRIFSRAFACRAPRNKRSSRDAV